MGSASSQPNAADRRFDTVLGAGRGTGSETPSTRLLFGEVRTLAAASPAEALPRLRELRHLIDHEPQLQAARRELVHGLTGRQLNRLADIRWTLHCLGIEPDVAAHQIWETPDGASDTLHLVRGKQTAYRNPAKRVKTICGRELTFSETARAARRGAWTQAAAPHSRCPDCETHLAFRGPLSDTMRLDVDETADRRLLERRRRDRWKTTFVGRVEHIISELIDAPDGQFSSLLKALLDGLPAQPEEPGDAVLDAIAEHELNTAVAAAAACVACDLRDVQCNRVLGTDRARELRAQFGSGNLMSRLGSDEQQWAVLIRRALRQPGLTAERVAETWERELAAQLAEASGR